MEPHTTCIADVKNCLCKGRCKRTDCACYLNALETQKDRYQRNIEYLNTLDIPVSDFTMRIIVRGIVRQYLNRDISIQQYSEAIVAVVGSENKWSEMVVSEIENYYS